MAAQRRILRLISKDNSLRSLVSYHSGNVHQQQQQMLTGISAPAAVVERSTDDSPRDTDILRNKSNWEILRALMLLHACKYDTFINNSVKLYQKSRAIFGKRLVDYVAHKTFYQQFCGGNTEAELCEVERKLAASGIATQVAAIIEDPIDPTLGTREFYDTNLTKLLDAADLSSRINKNYNPHFQIRITALLPGRLMSKITTELKNQGEHCVPVEELAETLVTGKEREYKCLSCEENRTLHEGLMRFQEVGKKVQFSNIRTLIDAEYTSMNPAFNIVVMALALVYNRQTPIFWNTFQCYLKNALRDLDEQLAFAEKHRICFGAKVVRGAYLLSETARANELGIENPVCDSYEATSANYDQAVERLLGLVADKYPDYHMIVASHNEESIRKAIERMSVLGISPNHGTVSFGQLYGMCDQVSYHLGQRGYRVYKAVPIGSLEESLPYLSRRAYENKSVMAGVRKELTVLRNVMKQRLVW